MRLAGPIQTSFGLRVPAEKESKEEAAPHSLPPPAARVCKHRLAVLSPSKFASAVLGRPAHCQSSAVSGGKRGVLFLYGRTLSAAKEGDSKRAGLLCRRESLGQHQFKDSMFIARTIGYRDTRTRKRQ